MWKLISQDFENHRKTEYFNFLILLFLAVVVYLQQAWVPGFFHDGYLYAAFGKHASELGHWLIPHLNNSTYAEFPDHSPFLFIVEGLFFKIVGSGIVQARFFGALFTIGTLIYLYFWALKQNKKFAYYSCLVFILIYPLIKKTRFPNMDVAIMLTMFVALTSYFDAAKGESKKWILCGLFSGLSLLIKGPIAFLIPLIILIHSLVEKSFKKLFFNPFPWLGLLLAVILSSIWPLSLYFNDKFYIFEKYLYSTFSHTLVSSRGLTEKDYFAYLVFLVKKTLPWFICLLIALKKNKSEIVKFSLVSFFTMIIFFSLQTLKYSHYLIPLYPFYALIGGSVLSSMHNKYDVYVTYSIKWLSVLTALALLVFPLTTKVKRDFPLNKTQELLSSQELRPNAWAIINDSYPFFAATNFFAYYNHDEVYRGKEEMILSWLKGQKYSEHVIKDFDHDVSMYRWGFLVRKNDMKRWEGQFSNFNEVFVKLVAFDSKNLAVLIPKIYMNSDTFLNYP